MFHFVEKITTLRCEVWAYIVKITTLRWALIDLWTRKIKNITGDWTNKTKNTTGIWTNRNKNE